jgi:hypothetical protein
MIINEVLIQGFARSVKDGKLSIEQVPEIYREEVRTKVGGTQ